MFLFQITVKPTNFEKLYNGIEGFKLGILRFGMESAILKRVKNKSVLTQNWDMSVPKFSLSLRRFFFLCPLSLLAKKYFVCWQICSLHQNKPDIPVRSSMN